MDQNSKTCNLFRLQQKLLKKEQKTEKHESRASVLSSEILHDHIENIHMAIKRQAVFYENYIYISLRK